MDEPMQNERDIRNDELERDEEPPSRKEVPPRPSADEIRQQIEEEDRFEATDN
jgi:hypothetical protein